jgi:hypothetical protein
MKIKSKKFKRQLIAQMKLTDNESQNMKLAAYNSDAKTNQFTSKLSKFPIIGILFKNSYEEIGTRELWLEIKYLGSTAH